MLNLNQLEQAALQEGKIKVKLPKNAFKFSLTVDYPDLQKVKDHYAEVGYDPKANISNLRVKKND